MLRLNLVLELDLNCNTTCSPAGRLKTVSQCRTLFTTEIDPSRKSELGLRGAKQLGLEPRVSRHLPRRPHRRRTTGYRALNATSSHRLQSDQSANATVDSRRRPLCSHLRPALSHRL